MLSASNIKEIPIIAQMIERVSTSETLENFYETTRRNIPKEGHLRGTYCLYLQG
jgi:hypothetical protein